jgi:hypothetical protein
MDLKKHFPAAVGNFYSRYRRELPVIGAFIVLATYISQDYLRENVKDIADSIGRAQESFLIRAELRSQDETLGQISHNVEQIYSEVFPPGRTPDKGTAKYLEFYRNENDRDEALNRSDQLLARNIDDLYKKVSPDADLKAKIDRVEDAVKKKGGLITDLSRVLHDSHPETDKIGSLDREISSVTVPYTLDATQAVVSIEPHMAVEFLADDLLFKAERKQVWAEFGSQFLRYFGLFLYLLGFCLGLGGRLFGVEVIGSAE